MWSEKRGDAKWKEVKKGGRMLEPGDTFEKDGVNYLVLPDGRAAEIAYFQPDGTPVLRAVVTREEKGTDELGNKIVSTTINVEPFNFEFKET